MCGYRILVYSLYKPTCVGIAGSKGANVGTNVSSCFGLTVAPANCLCGEARAIARTLVISAQVCCLWIVSHCSGSACRYCTVCDLEYMHDGADKRTIRSIIVRFRGVGYCLCRLQCNVL